MSIDLHGVAEMFFECDWVGAGILRNVERHADILDKLDAESKNIKHGDMSLRTRYIRHIWGDEGAEGRVIDLSKAARILVETDVKLMGPFKYIFDYKYQHNIINWPYSYYFDLDETFSDNRLVYWSS